jgi:hypothetical protein
MRDDDFDLLHVSRANHRKSVHAEVPPVSPLFGGVQTLITSTRRRRDPSVPTMRAAQDYAVADRIVSQIDRSAGSAG